MYVIHKCADRLNLTFHCLNQTSSPTCGSTCSFETLWWDRSNGISLVLYSGYFIIEIGNSIDVNSVVIDNNYTVVGTVEWYYMV